MDAGFFKSLEFVSPELALLATAAAIWGLERAGHSAERLGDIALAGVALALVAMALVPHELSGWLLGGLLVHDPFASFFKVVIALVAMVAIWMSIGADSTQGGGQAPYVRILTATAAACILPAAANLLVAFLAFEALVWAIQGGGVGTAANDSDRQAVSPSAWARSLGPAWILMTAALLWIAGVAGSLDLVAVQAAVDRSPEAGGQLPLALCLLWLGVVVRLWRHPRGAAGPLRPAHGAATFFALASLVAASGALLRLLFPTLSTSYGYGTWVPLAAFDWSGAVALVSMLAMTTGNLAALGTRQVYPLFVYLGIAQIGYIALGIAAVSGPGIEAAMFHLLAHVVAFLGVASVMAMLPGMGHGADLASVRGLAWRGGWLPAVALGLFAASALGLPPFLGFFAKLFVFTAVMEQGLHGLAAVAAVNLVLTAAVVARLGTTLFAAVDGAEATAPGLRLHEGALVGFLLIVVCVFGFLPSPLFAFARYSLQFYVG